MALLVYYLIGCGIAILAIIRMFTTVFFYYFENREIYHNEESTSCMA